ncbi:MAG TPA: vanadium-dependent haloperoxidase [Ktedonobacteraceae bacterium]
MDDNMNGNHSSNRSLDVELASLIAPLRKPVSRRTILKTGTGLLVMAAGAGTFFELHRSSTFAKQQTDNVAIQWNNAALQAIRDKNPGPTIGSRALAIMHTSMYDAWAASDAVAVPTRPNGIPRQKPKWKDISQAVSYAAFRSLMNLFPSEASVFTSLMNNLGYNPTDTSTDTTTPTGVGNVAAQAVLSFRLGDGSNQQNGYADTSGYVPVNSPTQILSPLHWQPLLINGKVQTFLTPHWGTVTPFALSSGSQFRPAGPVMDPTSSAYINQAATIVQYNANLTDTTKTISGYWANGPHSETPPGHWELFAQFASAQFISHQNKHDISGDVKMFFALSNAVFDAGIAAWDAKRTYDYVRPITAVRYLNAGHPLVCWGGPGNGTVKMPDGANFIPYQEAIVVTPPFPEYVSGHSTFSAAGAYIMRQSTGSDTFGNSFTAAPGSSQIEPGAPTQSVTLSWATFSAAAAEAGISRQYGGIHFNQGDQDGRVLGKQVATVAWTKAQNYINGTPS